MEILKDVVSKIKSEFTNRINQNYMVKNYGVDCNIKNIRSFESIKLELIFLSNINYICLNDNQIKKIKSRNYKNLLKKDDCICSSNTICTEDPILVGDITLTTIC